MNSKIANRGMSLNHSEILLGRGITANHSEVVLAEVSKREVSKEVSKREVSKLPR